MSVRWWPVYAPADHVELAILESILIGDGVPYFVHNRHFGALRVGPRIPLYNERTVWVPEPDIPRARELFVDYFERTNTPASHRETYSLLDRLRVLIEFWAFGWFIPGHRRRRDLDR